MDGATWLWRSDKIFVAHEFMSCSIMQFLICYCILVFVVLFCGRLKVSTLKVVVYFWRIVESLSALVFNFHDFVLGLGNIESTR